MNRLADLEDIRPGDDLDAIADEAARIAAAATDAEVRLRAQLLQADVAERTGGTGAAARMVWEVNRWAAEHGSRPLLSRSHLLLSRVYHHLGDAAASLEHAVASVEFMDDGTVPRSRVTCLIRLADALSSAGSFEDSRQRYAQAEKLAVALGDVDRQITVLNNLAYTEYEAGEPDRAWVAAERLREVAAAHDVPIDHNGLDTVARIQIALGRYADAAATMRRCIDDFVARGVQETAALAEYLLTLAVAQRHAGALDDAQAALDRSRVLCEERELADTRTRVREEQAAVYAARGEYRRAYAEHLAFHAEHELLRARQREAQARTRQAMFETAEARRDAERFREQAYRDPLTGLANRRYVDEQLPVLLRSSAPLSLALVDLDHFKRVNDTLSHEVGDQVLVATAGILAREAAAMAEGGFAARLGGEEFLVVLPGTPAGRAVERIGTLLERIRGYDWRPVTGALPVTASIGLVTAEPGQEHTQPALLSAADRNLYRAKRAGRDRLVSDPPTRQGRRRYRDGDSPA